MNDRPSHDLTCHAFVNQQGEGGNPCHLSIYISKPSTELKSLYQSTHCHVWPVSTDTLIVECHNQTRKIQCCGHGLLSAASYWLEEHTIKKLTLTMSDAEIVAVKENDKTWLRFQTLETTKCTAPRWCKQVLGVEPIKAATAGDDNGYLILQYPDNFMLSSISAPGKDLQRHTQRAIIACCISKDNNADINLRYFAPQYGTNEDTATGSAMRAIADYWSPRYQALSAVQCGPNNQKGYLFSRLTNNHIEIGGYCRLEGY